MSDKKPATKPVKKPKSSKKGKEKEITVKIKGTLDEVLRVSVKK